MLVFDLPCSFVKHDFINTRNKLDVSCTNGIDYNYSLPVFGIALDSIYLLIHRSRVKWVDLYRLPPCRQPPDRDSPPLSNPQSLAASSSSYFHLSERSRCHCNLTPPVRGNRNQARQIHGRWIKHGRREQTCIEIKSGLLGHTQVGGAPISGVPSITSVRAGGAPTSGPPTADHHPTILPQ